MTYLHGGQHILSLVKRGAIPDLIFVYPCRFGYFDDRSSDLMR